MILPLFVPRRISLPIGAHERKNNMKKATTKEMKKYVWIDIERRDNAKNKRAILKLLREQEEWFENRDKRREGWYY